MDGTKTRKSESWRITVVAETFTDLNTIIGELEELDNTSQYGFATIYSELVLVEAKEEDAIYRRAFIDLTLY